MLWRNNNGAMVDKDGRLVRYGLGNDSKSISEVLKSSDLIGLTGDGRFLAVEVKAPGWRYTATSREVAQARFLRRVIEHGGIGIFATSVADLTDVLAP